MMKRLLVSAASAAALMAAAPAMAADVGLELGLLIDVSGSVDANEYNLQKQGYVQAFQSAAVQNAIAASQLGKIAVTFVEWSGGSEQTATVGWTVIDCTGGAAACAASANAFAAAVNATSRTYAGLTAPGSAINFVTPGFASNGIDGLRQVIDVSGEEYAVRTANRESLNNDTGVDFTQGGLQLRVVAADAQVESYRVAGVIPQHHGGGAGGFAEQYQLVLRNNYRLSDTRVGYRGTDNFVFELEGTGLGNLKVEDIGYFVLFEIESACHHRRYGLGGQGGVVSLSQHMVGSKLGYQLLGRGSGQCRRRQSGDTRSFSLYRFRHHLNGLHFNVSTHGGNTDRCSADFIERQGRVNGQSRSRGSSTGTNLSALSGKEEHGMGV